MAGDADVAWSTAAAAGDLELSASNVELWDTSRVWVVDAELLGPEKPLATWDTSWDSDLV